MMHSTFSRFFFLLFSLLLAGSALAVTPLTDEEAGDNRDARSTRPPRSRAPQNRSSTVVVIDPGHGGFDRGGIPRQAVPEKAMTLDVSLRLRSVLEKSGYRVVMTRDRDVFVSLPGRVAIANSYNNAIFVCVHFNSATRVGANGIETYFYSRESLPLASAIHYNVAAGAPSPNRGVRRRGYYVLRKTRIPAVLVECGFLTNPTEARYVQDSRYRQKLAEEIGRGIGARSSVTTSSTRLTDDGRVPLQPFIDQTRARDRESSRSSHKSSKKKSKSKSKRSTSSDSDEPSPPTKKRKKKPADASDSENARPKKKSSSEQTEN